MIHNGDINFISIIHVYLLIFDFLKGRIYYGKAFDNLFIKKKYRLEIHGCAHFDNFFL